MTTKIAEKAVIPNPALKPFEVLIGEWQTSGSHPYHPGIVLTGRTSIKWFDEGAFVIIRSEINESHFPDGIAIIGSDDAEKNFYMLYFDSRGVSRKYNVSSKGKQIKWWREDPSFSQRMSITIENNGNMLISQGEMSRDGGPWEKDLALTYMRIKSNGKQNRL